MAVIRSGRLSAVALVHSRLIVSSGSLRLLLFSDSAYSLKVESPGSSDALGCAMARVAAAPASRDAPPAPKIIFHNTRTVIPSEARDLPRTESPLRGDPSL